MESQFAIAYRLYLPELWANDNQLRQLAELPGDIVFPSATPTTEQMIRVFCSSTRQLLFTDNCELVQTFPSLSPSSRSKFSACSQYPRVFITERIRESRKELCLQSAECKIHHYWFFDLSSRYARPEF